MFFLKIFSFLFLLSTMVQAEYLFIAQDLQTIDISDKSEARSLNESGWIAGKYFQDSLAVDFLWTPEAGLQQITDQADKEIFPKVNNLGNVIGFVVHPGSWFSSTKLQTYTFTSSGRYVLHGSNARDNGVSFLVSNKLFIISDHANVFQSKHSYFTANDEIIDLFDNTNSIMKCYPTAINENLQMLVTGEAPGIFGSSMLGTYALYIYDFTTGKQKKLASDQFYHGLGINNQNLVIACNQNRTEGFYGTEELNMVSLKGFIPVDLNNHGDIVGKKNKAILLRKKDGTFIDLQACIDCNGLPIEKLVDVWAINDLGQILVTGQANGKTHAFLLFPKK